MIAFKRWIELVELAGYESRPYTNARLFPNHCLSVQCDRLMDFAAALVMNAFDQNERELVAAALHVAQVDNLFGMKLVVYFPQIEWEQHNSGASHT